MREPNEGGERDFCRHLIPTWDSDYHHFTFMRKWRVRESITSLQKREKGRIGRNWRDKT